MKTWWPTPWISWNPHHWCLWAILELTVRFHFILPSIWFHWVWSVAAASVSCTAPVKKLGVPVCYLSPFLFNNFLVELGDSSQVNLSAKCMWHYHCMCLLSASQHHDWVYPVASRIVTETQDVGFVPWFCPDFWQIIIYYFPTLHPSLGADEVIGKSWAACHCYSWWIDGLINIRVLGGVGILKVMESNEPVDLFLLPGTSASTNHLSYLQLPTKNSCTNFSFFVWGVWQCKAQGMVKGLLEKDNATSLLGWSMPVHFGAGLAFDKKGGRLGRGGGWVLKNQADNSFYYLRRKIWRPFLPHCWQKVNSIVLS